MKNAVARSWIRMQASLAQAPVRIARVFPRDYRDIGVSGYRGIGVSELVCSEFACSGFSDKMLAVTLDQHQQLRKRTKDFALRVIRMTQALPKTKEADVMGRQVLRCSTSVAANYRATGQARSKAEFISKMAQVVEEADETIFWLEMLGDSAIIKSTRIVDLLTEANQLVAIFGASLRTARNK